MIDYGRISLNIVGKNSICTTDHGINKVKAGNKYFWACKHTKFPGLPLLRVFNNSDHVE